MEGLLLLARELPWPGAWAWLELLAAVSAGALFFWRSRGLPELRRAFILALPLSALGAVLLGSALRLLAADSGDDRLGVSSYGALIGMGAGFVVLSRRSLLSATRRLQLLAPSLLLLAGCGRLGCFAAGCEPGQVTAKSFAVRFPRGSATFREHVAEGWVLPSDAWSLAVHSVQLYEALLSLGLLGLILALERRPLRPELLLASVALAYLASRLAVDLCRA